MLIPRVPCLIVALTLILSACHGKTPDHAMAPTAPLAATKTSPPKTASTEAATTKNAKPTPKATSPSEDIGKAPAKEDFEKISVGKLPPHFTPTVGRWEVTSAKTPGEGTHVLAQGAKSAGNIFNVMLISGTSYRDVDVSVGMRAVAGHIDQGGGCMWRARDTHNYYVARYNPLEDNFRVYTVVKGHRRMIGDATVRLPHAAWHTLRISMKGDHIKGYLDGSKHLDVHDTTFGDTGQIGLWTKADAQTHFDDLRVHTMLPTAPKK
ncbi:MAG: DUF1080 domain-containing protein [Deltaproteobacteria bacterium]|nr:DUF1080 domain-containing protein [Deltaproteobacteria bacterium]